MKKYVGRIHAKEDTEKLGYQNEYIRVESSEEGLWYYLPFIAVLVSSFSFGMSVALWLSKIL